MTRQITCSLRVYSLESKGHRRIAVRKKEPAASGTIFRVFWKENLTVIWKYPLLKICELCFNINVVLTSLVLQILLQSQSTNLQLRLKSCLQPRLLNLSYFGQKLTETSVRFLTALSHISNTTDRFPWDSRQPEEGAKVWN